MSMTSRVSAHVDAHLASGGDELVLGWLVGAYGPDGEPAVLGAVRCLHGAARADRVDAAAVPSADWGAETSALTALLPGGMSVVGYYVSVTVADDSIAATPTASAVLNGAPAGAPWPAAGRVLVVAVAALPTAAVHFGRAQAGAWAAVAPTELDAAASRFTATAVFARCAVTLPLTVSDEGGGGNRSAAALDDARVAAAALLEGPGAHFALAGAPELGVLAFDAPAAPTVASALAAAAPKAGATAAAPKAGASVRLLEFELLWAQTAAGSAQGPVSAPVVTLFDARAAAPRAQLSAELDVSVLVPLAGSQATAAAAASAAAAKGSQADASSSQDVATLARALRAALIAQLGRLCARAAALDAPLAGLRARGCAFAAVRASACPPLFHAEYLLAAGEDASEASAREARGQLHARLGLGTDRPLLRTCNALPVAGAIAASSATRLVNVHAGCAASGLKTGKVAVVQGSYEYFHYMQDHFDDKGWGCAYRSLMTIVSWFRMQHFTAALNPMHDEIQRRLVADCAQPAALLNSKRWIGALDVSLYLEVALGVSCRIENVASGAELAHKGRMLLRHFETVGTPVMMGGGELAYTLLGVHFDDQTGDIRFLILDPHYTNPNSDLGEIYAKKWCGWHAVDKFEKNAFYNLCFPLCPDCI